VKRERWQGHTGWLLGLSVLSGCGGNSVSPEAKGTDQPFKGSYPIQVAATTGMVADLAIRVGGNHVKVTQLMGAGVDPHLYKASIADVKLLGNADLILYSGTHLEGKMADVFNRLARRRPTLAVTEAIDKSDILDNDEGTHDPHLWFDVSLWSRAAGAVQDVLVQFDPPHADDYKANAQVYQKELADLHRYAREQIARIPKEQRVLVTAHDAFRYFGRAYDIEVRGIQGISTEDVAGVKHINDLVDFLTRRKIKAVFVESSVSEKNINALIEGCVARGHKVVKGGELFSDAMGDAGTPEGTYVGMVRHNVDTIVKALKGKDKSEAEGR
jgi:manganese/zinc/iron transport system substrate-binding protein